MNITFITSNNVKFRIAKEILSRYGVEIEQHKMDLPELQSIDLDEVAMDKARKAAETFKKDFIIDDTGFYIASLGNFPGALFKPTIYVLGEEKFLRLMNSEKDRKARFVSVLVFYDSRRNQFKLISSTINGKVTEELGKGTRRVGYSLERIFIPEGQKKAISDLDDTEWETLYNEIKRGLHYEEFGKWLVDGYGKL